MLERWQNAVSIDAFRFAAYIDDLHLALQARRKEALLQDLELLARDLNQTVQRELKCTIAPAK
eukprot:4619006-Lingulodinium_polyedra.AAC.1